MTVLVIGGSGFIGSHILAVAAAHRNVVGTFLSNQRQATGGKWELLDVRDAASVKKVITSVAPDIVIQVCGTKSIEYCDAEPEEAHRVHAEGTRHVVDACQQLGARLVYISTDCVFDGQKSSYSEQDPVCPFNVYGRVKQIGEQIVLNSGLEAMVIRASLLFGWRQAGQATNFVLLVLTALAASRPMPAAINLFNTPLEIAPAAGAMTQLALGQARGIFHIGGHDRISRYDFAVATAEIFGLDAHLVQAVEDTSGLRQSNSCLAMTKTETLLHTRLEGVKSGLARMAQAEPGKQLEES